MPKTLTAKKYQAATAKFAVFPKNFALEYLTLGLASEAGEVAGKAKKIIRGDYTEVGDVAAEGEQQLLRVDIEAFHSDLLAEIGDVLWYVSELCTLTGTTMEHVMAQNIVKLTNRLKNDQLKGSGDNR